MNTFTPSKPRVTGIDYRGAPGALLDLPGHRSRGVFIPRQHLSDVIDQLCKIENTEEQE